MAGTGKDLGHHLGEAAVVVSDQDATSLLH
jgi:hypothetical protein